MKIDNCHVYNLHEAMGASRYPMVAHMHNMWEDLEESERTSKVSKKLGAMERGSGHDNFLHGILVAFDLTCSNKMWVEFQRYHFAEIVSSQSTMHRIKQILEENIFNEYVTDNIKTEIYTILHEYNDNPTTENYLKLLYNIPSGIELTAHIVTNYGQLKTMYLQRYNHRLPEWRKFCDFILELPMFKSLTGIDKEEQEQ